MSLELPWISLCCAFRYGRGCPGYRVTVQRADEDSGIRAQNGERSRSPLRLPSIYPGILQAPRESYVTRVRHRTLGSSPQIRRLLCVLPTSPVVDCRISRCHAQGPSNSPRRPYISPPAPLRTGTKVVPTPIRQSHRCLGLACCRCSHSWSSKTTRSWSRYCRTSCRQTTTSSGSP